MRGFAALPLVIILAVVGVVAVGGWYVFSTKQPASETVLSTPAPTVSESPTSTPKPTITPKPTAVASVKPAANLIDCVGPDGKKSRKTQKDCDAFKKAWATPTPVPTPTPTSSQSGCNTDTNLGNLTVKIEPQSGQSLVGDAAVTMSNGSGDCAGTDARLPMVQVISQGSTTTTFPSFRPAKFHIKVTYHGNDYNSDVSLNSGDNTVTITVSN